MGFRTYSAIAPFKINIGESLPGSMGDFVYGKFEPFNENGWYCEHNEWIEDLGPVYTTPFIKGNVQINDDNVKGDYKVLLVNESPYSNIGRVNYSIVAKDRKSIERFCEDFNINTEIIENTTVQFSI